MPDIRTETDSLGVIEVPADKPWVFRYNVRSS
jgi:fumarate hydratase class II